MPLEKIISLESRHAQRKAKLVMGDCPLAVELHKRSFLRQDIEVCHVPPELLIDGGRKVERDRHGEPQQFSDSASVIPASVDAHTICESPDPNRSHLTV